MMVGMVGQADLPPGGGIGLRSMAGKERVG